MRVLIIGGGIAGSAAALALHKARHVPVVYEAHPDSGEDLGAFLTLASNGMRALGQIGADRLVADLGFPLTALRLLDASGAKIADSPLGEHDHSLTRYRCLRRADLAVALQREVERRGIAIRHGSRLESLTEDSAGVTAQFADGHSATGGLLVGADGLTSTVRSLIGADADPVTPRYAGQRVFYGYTAKAQPGESEYITMIRGSAAAFGYASSPDGETFWFARVADAPVSADEIAATTPGQWRDQLVPLLRRDTTPAADIVEATDEQLMVTNACDLPAGMAWRTPRTLLIGDAAHAASPATGQGASMALEDAVILAKALRDGLTVEAALSAYERLRRPRVEHNIVVSAEMTAGRRPSQSSPVPDEELIHQLDWTLSLPR
jgi:2-polyprenyl-6-methoxyphenol hydroxylase-like FAD-dependent oxidoreductase